MQVRPQSAIFAAVLLASPLVSSTPVYGNDGIPSGGRPSPRFGAQPFTQQLLLFEEFGVEPMATEPVPPGLPLPCPQSPVTCPPGTELDAFLSQPLYPEPTVEANEQDMNPWRPLIESTLGRSLDTPPCDGRPPGPGWSHQRWAEFPPVECFQAAQTGARRNSGLRDARQRHGYAAGEFGPGGLYHNTVGLPGFEGTTSGIDVRFHPNMPIQDPRALWTFDGTFPAKLLVSRHGRSVLFRHHNALPVDPAANFGFGMHTLSTHHHNGHNPSESDGYAHAFTFPGQFWDYRWPMILAGYDSINTTATDPRAGYPDDDGGIVKIRGDWRETASTLWFHDHMEDYTSQNVYKGNAAMNNIYSAVDRGNEAIEDGVNLRLPSGSALPWGNRDYDVNLVLGDKAWDQNGQLWFNHFQTEGFLGDHLLTNWQVEPYLDVRARRYRFRILNGCIARYLKLALVKADGTPVPMYMVANDGGIMEHVAPFDGTFGSQRGVLPVQAIAERYDIVIDFSAFQPGERLYFVNVLEHDNGKLPDRVIPLNQILSGEYMPERKDDDGDGVADRWINGDPCVGKFMEFRVREYAETDLSLNPVDYVPGKRKMIPLPMPTPNEIRNAKRHSFVFGRGGTDEKPWTIKVDEGEALVADIKTVSVAANLGELSADGNGHLQVWTFKSAGGWAHPVHAHFEQAMVLSVNGQQPPPYLRWARKDVFRVGGGPESWGEIEVAMRFREFAGSYVEHCHNTTHEDTAMLLRWDIENPGQTIPLPSPMPSWDGVTYLPSYSLPLARTGIGVGPKDPFLHRELQIEAAEYSETQGWRIRGRVVNPDGRPRVRAFIGAAVGGGSRIGEATVAADGSFLIRNVAGARPPLTASMVSMRVDGGVDAPGVPFTRLP